MQMKARPTGLKGDYFHRINPRKNQSHTIEWTSKQGGWTRAKANDKMDFLYAKSTARDAEIVGWMIIDNQRRLTGV